MNFNKNLGLSIISNINDIVNDIKKNYKIMGEVSVYSPNFELLSYNTHNKYFNNRHKLLRLIKKCYRICYNGIVFKGLIKYRNKKYYKNIFIKEIPIYPFNITYKNNSNVKTLSSNEYQYQYFKYNTNSNSNVEIFISYVCSKMFETNISPSFCLMYGSYNVSLNRYSYTLNTVPSNFKQNYYNKLYTKDGDIILEKKQCPVYLLALEKLDFGMETIKELCVLDDVFFRAILFQIYAAIFTMFSVFGIKHNDLHIGNIMFMVTDAPFVYYKLGENIHKIPTNGFIIKIIDWGRGTYKHNLYEGKNSIFNKRAECENQMIFTRINKESYENYMWSDIVIITQNLLFNFPEIKSYRKLFMFMKKILRTSSGCNISTRTFNWETFEQISKNNFNIDPTVIINHPIFKLFKTKSYDPNEILFNIII